MTMDQAMVAVAHALGNLFMFAVIVLGIGLVFMGGVSLVRNRTHRHA